MGVPQGGPFSPLAANIYLNEVDWYFEAIRRKTAEGPFEAVNYHRFADDIVISVSGHHTKRGWAQRALQRLQERLAPLGVELNREKPRLVDTRKGGAFGFLGLTCVGYQSEAGKGISSPHRACASPAPRRSDTTDAGEWSGDVHGPGS
jgi:RNA-directed DNA polymerase